MSESTGNNPFSDETVAAPMAHGAEPECALAEQKPVSEKNETRADSARVELGYESLDAREMRKAFDEVNAALETLADTAIQALDSMVPYLAKMQSLLSQRGAARKRVLSEAKLPGWSEWAAAYGERLSCKLRTIQEHIKLYRSGEKPQRKGTGDKPLRLDARHQASLVKAQLAVNDLVAALKNGGDWKAPLAEYEKVAVTPAKLDAYVSALNPEKDWKAVLTDLIETLEQYGEKLPLAVLKRKQEVEALLRGKTAPVLPPPSSLSRRHYHVEDRQRDDGTYFVVIPDGQKEAHSTHTSLREADDMCESLNNSPVVSLADGSAGGTP